MQYETTTYINNEIRKNITNNKEYRKFLNSEMISRINFQNVMHENPIIKTNTTTTYPYLFDGINDAAQPYGYENSLPKQMFISEQQVVSQQMQKKYILI